MRLFCKMEQEFNKRVNNSPVISWEIKNRQVLTVTAGDEDKKIIEM